MTEEVALSVVSGLDELDEVLAPTVVVEPEVCSASAQAAKTSELVAAATRINTRVRRTPHEYHT